MRLSVCFLFLSGFCVPLFATNLQPWLINGNVVPAGDYPEIVRIEMGGGACTATVVGKRVLVTAAHCVEDGESVKFEYAGTSYTGTGYNSGLFETKDHDIGAVVVSTDIVGAKPMSIGGNPATGDSLHLFGYGCYLDSTWDDKLREGKVKITSVQAYYYVSGNSGTPLLCPGDSGGPGFVDTTNGKRLVAVNSAVGVDSDGNVVGPNFTTRTTVADSTAFLKRIATEQSVAICGVTVTCN